jgi:dihydroneopterin aldolase
MKTKKHNSKKPRDLAEEIAQKIVIDVLADEYRQIAKFRKELEKHGVENAYAYSGIGSENDTAEDTFIGRCPICYRYGELLGIGRQGYGACRKHKVYWPMRDGYFGANAEVEALLRMFRPVEPLCEPWALEVVEDERQSLVERLINRLSEAAIELETPRD